ncbi:hypothetical protein QBC46DRAFT_387985 [Diplogelasinospora grovesii]|uniref:Stress-response A/B barrel domain-containing protein n=1 Tax=Diplogelasinospora grovesii TaxID=303347 RepID=A0AAN6N5H6_9PEZI|nr:hypothetical protein QBC46DRAFT_387985 [Diplogelasinospora grovesii]
MASEPRIHRTTMFKIPNPEDQKRLLDAYQELARDQRKGGKPYILYMCAGPALEDVRSKGYTVVAKTEFATLDDMKYYDTECAAHAELKKKAARLGATEPPLAVCFEGRPCLM